jgi:chromosome segregation protein
LSSVPVHSERCERQYRCISTIVGTAMRLKRVRIFGFKTFADRTEFSLEGGIIAVVGPNGCGKSNLVDAILWALGESNARHLRAAASQDVIFGGSARRKPLGFAEVSLLFDNEDGSLPIDTPEVAVTRRLNRAGEGDYYINRRSCRQRDIHELLADSGLGRAGYAIVSQKEIDQALAASAEDRRAWVDEAAGVQRYRTRKLESLKRLASARDHLVRVDDILRELDSQRDPLREEAEVARKYKAATAALREVETGLLMVELSKSVAEISEFEQAFAASSQLARAENAKAEHLEQEILDVRAEAGALEHRIETIRSGLEATAASLQRSESAAKLGEERLRSLDEMEATLRGGESADAVAEASVDLKNCTRDAVAEELSLQQARQDVGGLGAEASALSQRLASAETALANARRMHASRLKQQAELEHREDRRRLAVRELLGIEHEIPRLKNSVAEAAAEAEAVKDAVEENERAAMVIEAKLVIFRSDEDTVSAEARALLAERAALDGRRRGIEETIHAHEGLSQGSRAVLEAAERRLLSDTYVSVAQAVRSRREHAVAIETALGAAANDLIVEDEEASKAAIQYLKEGKLGRATFQPIPLMRPHAVTQDLQRLLNEDGVVGRASELVECLAYHRPVIDSLLGRIIIVEDLDTSLRLARTSGWSRIVTLDGEVVHASGAVSGGQSGKVQYGMVQRSADLAHIEAELSGLDRRISVLGEKSERTAKARAQLAIKLVAVNSELANNRRSFADARDFLHTLTSELQTTQRSHDKLTKDLQSFDQQIVIEDAVDLDQLQLDRDTFFNEFAGRSADANQAKERLRDAESRLQQAQLRMQAAAKRLKAIHDSTAERELKLVNLGPERERIRADIERHNTELGTGQARWQAFQDDLLDHQTKRDKLVNRTIAFSEEVKSSRANLAAIADANHQAELSRARAESRRAVAAERLLEEYGISQEEAVSQASSLVVAPDAQAVANRLRREIRAMGMVNVGAVEAYERLTTRHDELSAQRSDIVEGIEQVRAGMLELDKLTRDRFTDTFEKVERAFAELFQKLFGGGEGRMFLDDPSSILDSGIEIEVTLPGKKRQRLELLSGGERALCASGFLFALLKVKPSPLVVLDEVDAPLDGRNVERFGDVLSEFTDRTQFIIITHNPTTIERAPIWLGVTMQEPGVSTLVPARMPVVDQHESGGGKALRPASAH